MAKRDDWDDDVIFEDDNRGHIRPYLVTSGRTQVSVEGIAFETLVQKNPEESRRVRFEAAEVMRLAEGPISVAEISAHLNMPIGTTLVLISDLVHRKYLLAHKTVAQAPIDDINLITRIIAGVRQL